MLSIPDTRALDAAYGWLELRNWREARTELARISEPGRESLPAKVALIDADYWEGESTRNLLLLETSILALLAVTSEVGSVGYLRLARFRWIHGDNAPAAYEILRSAEHRFGSDYALWAELSLLSLQVNLPGTGAQCLEIAMCLGPHDDIAREVLNTPAFETLWPIVSGMAQACRRLKNVSRN